MKKFLCINNFILYIVFLISFPFSNNFDLKSFLLSFKHYPGIVNNYSIVVFFRSTFSETRIITVLDLVWFSPFSVKNLYNFKSTMKISVIVFIEC